MAEGSVTGVRSPCGGVQVHGGGCTVSMYTKLGVHVYTGDKE